MQSSNYKQSLIDNRKAKESMDLTPGTEYLARDVYGNLHVVKVDRETPHGVEMSIHHQDGTVTYRPSWSTSFIGLQRAISRV